MIWIRPLLLLFGWPVATWLAARFSLRIYRLRWLLYTTWLAVVSPACLLFTSLAINVSQVVAVADSDLRQIPYGDVIAAKARRYDLDPALLTAVIETESGFDPTAVSVDGAAGLGQLMPIIISWCGIGDPFVPEENLDCSARFLSLLVHKYDRLELAIAAYNAGEPRVDACLCVPATPNNETAVYVSRVLNALRHYQMLPMVAKLYATSNPAMTQAWHTAVAGYGGEDWAAGCNTPLFAPITGEVIYVGGDGRVGPNSRDGAESSMLVIHGYDRGAVLFHGRWSVGIGDQVQSGATRIGSEAAIGDATGCHTHVVLRPLTGE